MTQTQTSKTSLTSLALTIALCASFSWNADAVDARTLPKGRSRFSVMYGFSNDIQDVFTSEGKRESAVAEYNIQLSANNFKSALPEITQLIDYLNSTGYHYDISQRHTSNHGIVSDPTKPKLGDALERGFLDVGAAGDRAQYNLMYQYGLTDRLSVGFGLPFIKQSINLKAGIIGANTANDIYNAFESQNPGALGELVNTLNYVRGLSTETLQGFLQSRGYNRVESQSQSGIGDLVVGGRYKYFEKELSSGQWIASGQLGVTIPTGRVFDPADVLAIDFGQGAFDVATAHLVNYRPVHWLMLSNSVNYTHRFPTSRAERVPVDKNDVLPEYEEVVDVSLGDKFWVTLGANFTLTSFLSFDTNYEWYWKGKDIYKGSRRDLSYGYNWLSEDTDLYLETLQMGLTFSSIKAFLDYKFPLPGDLSLNYYLPVRGRNTVIAPFLAAELALYF